MGMPVLVVEWDTWRIRTDTNSADGGTATWLTTEDQAAGGGLDVDTTFRIRWVISNTGESYEVGNVTMEFRVNTGTWTAVGGTADTTEAVIAYAAASSSASKSIRKSGRFKPISHSLKSSASR